MLFANALRSSHCCWWLLLFGSVVLACHAGQSSHSTHNVTESDKGSEVALRVGDILEVRLRSQPGTGYKWYVHPNSSSLLTLIDETQTKPLTSGFDRPVIQVFRFGAKRRGSGILLLHYIRPWEGARPDEETYNVRVSIR